MSRLSGQVINVHAHGATVRLDDATLATVPRGELESHRRRFEQALSTRSPLPFDVRSHGRGKIAVLAASDLDPVVASPKATISLTDDVFEERLAAYLRQTEEWAPPDKPQPFERHLIRKRRRTEQFERD